MIRYDPPIYRPDTTGMAEAQADCLKQAERTINDMQTPLTRDRMEQLLRERMERPK